MSTSKPHISREDLDAEGFGYWPQEAQDAITRRNERIVGLEEQFGALEEAARRYRQFVPPHLDNEHEVGAAEELDHYLIEASSPASIHKVGPAEGDPDEGQAQYPGRDDVGGADIPASERQ